MTGLRRDRMRHVGALVVSVALWAGIVWAMAATTRGGIAVDYLSFATGGRLVVAHPHTLYDIGAQAQTQAALLGYRPAGTGFPEVFANPPFVAVLMAPVAGLPLQTGTDVFAVVLVACIALTTVVLLRRLPRGWGRAERFAAASLIAASAASAYAVLLGQWAPLLVLASAVALHLIDHGRPALGGVALGLLLIKPQLVWLLVPTLLILGRPRILAGFIAAAAVLALISVAVVGIDGAEGYVSFLRGYSAAPVAIVGRSLPALVARALANAAVIPPLTLVLGAAGVVVLAALHRRNLDAVQVVATGVGLSLITSPHTNPQDLALLAVPALAVIGTRTTQVVVALMVLSAGIVAEFIVSWAVPLDAAAAIWLTTLATAPARPSGMPASAPGA